MKRRGEYFAGVVLILFGIWGLLQALGYRQAGLDRFWPVIVMAFGVFLLINGFSRAGRDPDTIWLGCAATLCGALFLYITLGYAAWADLRWLWPAFPAIAGIAWLAEWATDPHRVPQLILGLVALLVAGIGYGATSGYLEPAQWQRLAQFWPVILIAVGVGSIVQFLLRRR